VLAPRVRIIGAQSVETSAMSQSLAAGRVIDTVVTPTLADGLAGQIDAEALHIGQYCADEMALVTEAELGETIAWLHRTTGMAVEGAGAVTVAALRHGKITVADGPLVLLVSGRNIDPSMLQAQLDHFPG
jgi:threonine dehydratase